MREDLSNLKYVRVEVKTGPIIREVIRIEVVGQTVGTGDSMRIIDLEKTIETVIFKGILENMEDKIIEEAEIGQEKGHSQEIIVTIGIEVPVTVDQDLDLELVLTGIG